MSSCKDFWKYVYYKKNILIFLLTPLLMCPLLAVNYESKEARCGYVVGILLVLLITQAVPLPVVGLIPLLLLPLLEIMTMAEVCEYYMVEYGILFISVLLMSSAVKNYGLHRRIALRALLLAGSDPKWLLLALMAVVGFFSMWILNLALVSMMLPIVSALVDQLAASDKDASPDDENQSCQDIPIEDLSLKADDACDGMKRENITFPREGHIVKSTANPTETCNSKEPTYSNEDLKTCFNLGLIYSTTIGGAGSMVGTVTQILMNTYLEIYYGPEAKVNFGDWVLFSAPNQLVSLILGWAWLSLFYLDLKTSVVRCCRRKAKATKKTGIVRILRREYEKLGPIKWAEKMIIVVFLVLIVIWFFEDPNFMPGWSSWFMPGYVQVSTVTAGVALICYALPAEKPSINIRDDRKPYVGLLEWKSSESSVPWGIVLYLGGLLSTVQAMKVTGLTSSIEDQFAPLKELSPWLVMLIVTVVCSILTEFMTSSVIIAIVIPVLTQTALAHGIHPYYLVMSMTLSINFAFCLPAGSLVNALVISFESVTTFQMIKTGVMMNVICLTVVNISMNTYGWWLLGLDEVPDWALAANGTSAG